MSFIQQSSAKKSPQESDLAAIGTSRAPRSRSSSTVPSGIVSKYLVIECTKENEALTSGMIAFLETFMAPVNLNSHKQIGQWYHGDCRVVRHGKGTLHNGNKTVTGVWEHNMYRGPSKEPACPGTPALLSSADVKEEEEYESAIGSPPLSPPRGSRFKVPVATLLQSSQKSMSPLGSTIREFFFPDELLLYIFSFLDIQSLTKCAQVSTEWRRLINDPILWTEYHIRRWGLPDDKDNESTRDWREIVKGRFLLDKNWLNGQYHISTLRGHTGWVTCVDFYANKLVSSSYDGTVRIWNTQTGNMLQTLRNESNGMLSPVWCVQFDKNRIMTGSSDSKLREFDPNTGQCIRVIGGHDGGVKCLQFNSELLVTGSDDKTIKVFDVKTGKFVKTIKVPCAGSISSLQFQEDVLCTASKREKAIYIFDLRRSNHCQRVLEAHSKAVYCLQFDLASNRLVSGSRDRQIFVWDFESGQVIKKLSGHRYTVMSLRFDNNKIVSGAADDSLRIWDMHSGECIQILQGHTEMVTSLKFDSSKIVSGSADRTCTVWDFMRGNNRPEDRGFSFFGY